MRKMMNFALMAAMVCGLSLAVTSCKDDDKSDNNGGQATAEEQAAEDANTFWSVAANLVSPFDVTAEYKNKTFEPTIGEAEQGSTTVRVVTVPDVEAAANHFAALVAADAQTVNTTYTYQDDAVGKLTYTKSTDGKSLAKVDVSITQIPHLQQIVYKTVEQMGTNAVTDGVPYYSFGDVISRTRADGVKEYWMCIQAPFTKQGETNAVWATVSQLPKENIWSYTASNGYTYQVPYNIGTNEQYMKDLAEMLYAITSPGAWLRNLEEGPANMKAFNLVTKQNVKYINQWFWMRVLKAWQAKNLAQTIFGVDDVNSFGNTLGDQDNGLKLLYKGYSWWTKSSNNLSLYEASIAKGDGNEANARHVTWKEVKKNVIKPEKIEVNCVTQLKNGTQWINKDFFPEHYDNIATPRYIFRYATTRQLAGTTAFESMDNINGIKDEYVYTKEYNITVGSRQKMDNTIVKQEDYLADGAISADEVKVGYYLCADGRFCESINDANGNHNGAVAVVAYTGGNKRVEKGKDWNGLAISLITNPVGNSWSNEIYDNCPNLTMYDNYTYALDDFTGLAATEALAGGCGNLNHIHNAAEYCRDFKDKVNKRGNSISSWFLPSFGQWILAIEGLGGVWEDGAININTIVLQDHRLHSIYTGDNRFWTSSAMNQSNAYYFTLGTKFSSTHAKKDQQLRVIPFIAFKYGDGGKEDQDPAL